MLEVRLLGNFDIKRGNKTVSIPSRPAQSLFAFLILNAGTAYRREKLAGQLWPDSTEEQARDYLRHALWRIRKALQDASTNTNLQADDLTISFSISPTYWLDAASLREADEHGSIDELIQALSVYTGELLPGFYDEWVVLEREHVQAVYERKVSRLLELLNQAGRWSEVMEWAEKWIALGQKSESAYRHLMSAYAAQGDRARAAAVYERCVKSLAEFGIEPSEQTRRLYHDLKAGGVATGVQFRPVQMERQHGALRNIPSPLTSFIGREREMTEVLRLLQKNRLVTLTGPGGVGKTRLAIELAHRLRGKFEDGMCWIDLAPISEPGLVTQAIASPLDVKELQGQSLTDTLTRYLASKQLLLILDNCEHLIMACARIIELLAGSCPNLKILTTSREALGISGEKVYEVPTLRLPQPQGLTLIDLLREYESVRLLVERARAVRSDFELTEQNAAAVYQICQRLDGIPLALELAAARTKLLSVEHVAARLNDRFNLLTQGSRTALPRQQTLRATIDWSYDLLFDDTRILFQRLSVFSGGFTMEAAEAVCSDPPLSSHMVLDLLARLVDRSLVKVEHQGSFGRYRMLETIRQYAYERLQVSHELDRLRARHRDFFIALAEQAEPKIKGSEQVTWLDYLESEHANLRSAWDCAMEAEPQSALRLVSALANFWYLRGNPGEGRDWLAQLLRSAGQWGATAEHAHILSLAGRLAIVQKDSEAARTLLEEALLIARDSGDEREVALALQWLGWTIALGQQDPDAAQAYLAECRFICERLGDRWGMAVAMDHLGAIAVYQGRDAEAKELCGTSLALFQELGDKYWSGATLNNLGELSRTQGNYEEAATYYKQSWIIAREMRSHVAMAVASGNLGWVALHEADYAAALNYFGESLRYSLEFGSELGATTCLGGLAAALAMIGKTYQAAQLFSSVDALLKKAGIAGRIDPVDLGELDHYLSILRGQIDPAAFEGAWHDGQGMTLERATAFALASMETDQDLGSLPA